MTNIVKCKSILSVEIKKKILNWSDGEITKDSLVLLLSETFKIDATLDRDIVSSYERDYSNMPGEADILCRPINDIECAIILKCCRLSKIPITVSAGRTNLNGGATPNGGVILSMEKMLSPKVKVNQLDKTVEAPVGIYLEKMRDEILLQSNRKLYYPVDPTSRNDAMVGGTLSCNASGFVPGDEGATRFWTEAIQFLLPNGLKLSCKRGQYISRNSYFILKCSDSEIKMKIPNYDRPTIKNASGPFSDKNGKIDLVDLIVGSEGIFGVITAATFRLKNRPNNFLDLFFTLPQESDAINFHKYISKYFYNNLSQLSALEYFGYNCQNYMDNRNELFENKTDVGIYLQVPLYNHHYEEIVEDWYEILNKSRCNINMEKILLLNDSKSWKMFFKARHSIPENALRKSHQLDTWSILTDTIVPAKNFKSFLDFSHKVLKNSNIEYLLFGHLGDCHLHYHLIPTKLQQRNALNVYQEIIKKTISLGGVYSAEHGTGKRKRNDFYECFGQSGINKVKATKSSLDPDFLLNRGNIFN